jgi:hypothetical protein
MDMEFEVLESESDNALVNCTSAREHVGDIERSIRTIRERARCDVSKLPFGHCMPDAMVIQLIYNVIFWLNVPIWENGASGEYSPREIVTGFKVNFKKHCRAIWGSYIEASVDPNKTNSLDAQTAPYIHNQRLQFLNRHKEKFDWDNDDLDNSPDLVQPAHPTDAIPAEKMP